MSGVDLSDLARSVDSICAKVDRLLRERDELLKALKALARRCRKELIDPVDVWELEAAETAIAKAEGQAE